MPKHKLHKWLIDAILQVPFLAHGWWNLTEGSDWWLKNFPSFYWGRFLIGGIELVVPFAMLKKETRRSALVISAVLMMGAVWVHLEHGYSFKTNGYETPLSYLLLSLGLLLKSQEEETA